VGADTTECGEIRKDPRAIDVKAIVRHESQPRGRTCVLAVAANRDALEVLWLFKHFQSQ
jgi:hypothetical protein